jgi:hypothetical protein
MSRASDDFERRFGRLHESERSRQQREQLEQRLRCRVSSALAAPREIAPPFVRARPTSPLPLRCCRTFAHAAASNLSMKHACRLESTQTHAGVATPGGGTRRQFRMG